MKIWIVLLLAAGAAQAEEKAPRIYRFSERGARDFGPAERFEFDFDADFGGDDFRVDGFSADEFSGDEFSGHEFSGHDFSAEDFSGDDFSAGGLELPELFADNDEPPAPPRPPSPPRPPAPPAIPRPPRGGWWQADGAPSRHDHEHLPGDPDGGTPRHPGDSHIFRFGAGGQVEEEDEDASGVPRGVTARAEGRGSASLAVKGPVNFRLRAQSGDVEVTAGDGLKVAIQVTDAPAEELELLAFGDHVEPRFGSRRQQLRRGKLHVELPKGSQLDVVSMSGDVQVKGVGGEVRIRTMSGDVKLAGISRGDVQSISGDVAIEGALGPVRLRTVSGHAALAMTGAAPQLDFQSASGNLDWSGACGKECRLKAETMSGDLNLLVDPQSSFELSYTSHSGELRDELPLEVKHAPKTKHGRAGGWLEATYGKGEGVIEADAFSGTLVVRKK